MIPLFVLPLIILVMLASSIGGDRLYGIVLLCRPLPHQDWGRARAACNRFARDDKEPGPQLEAKQLLGERPQKIRRDATHEPSAKPVYSEERRHPT